MIRRILIPLSLCCAVLCAFVGFLSTQAIDEAERIATQSLEFSCEAMIRKPPKESTGVILSDYIGLDLFATVDIDDDDRWEEIAIPLFSKSVTESKHAYCAVIAVFNNVPDDVTLREVLSQPQLHADYWPAKKLPVYLHSQLAVKFRNMDFTKSPVVMIGYPKSNPLLGEASLQLSKTVGIVALGIAGLTFLFSMVLKLFKLIKIKPKPQLSKPGPTRNRAGLPTNADNLDLEEPTGGVLDRVRSMRDQQPET
jgi:hypothetical protein